jgi:hypothetical protein
MASVAV